MSGLVLAKTSLFCFTLNIHQVSNQSMLLLILISFTSPVYQLLFPGRNKEEIIIALCRGKYLYIYCFLSPDVSQRIRRKKNRKERGNFTLLCHKDSFIVCNAVSWSLLRNFQHSDEFDICIIKKIYTLCCKESC